jgi:hypothetical protein
LEKAYPEDRPLLSIIYKETRSEIKNLVVLIDGMDLIEYYWLYSPYQTAYVVKISEPYHVLVMRYRENNLNKEFIKIFQTNKN